jgi:signal transduction histidine kinase
MTDPQIERERAILYQMASDLTQATTPDMWMEAIIGYAFQRGAKATVFSWIMCDSDSMPIALEIAAWKGNVSPLAPKVGELVYLDVQENRPGGMFGERNMPTFIEDIETSIYFSEVGRRFFREEIQIRSMIFLPMYVQGRWVSSIGVQFAEPNKFDDEIRRIYTAILPHAGSVIHSLRSQKETIAAKEESDFLYRLSQDFNAATTYQELMDAVARLQPDCDAVFLNLFENLDYDRATYLEVVAGTALTYRYTKSFGVHHPLTMYPIGTLIRHERFWAIEDIETDERVDPVTRQTWRDMGFQALICVNLFRGDCYMGLFFFEFKRPHHVTERERRLALGIADLTLSAIERILSHNEMLAAEEESEFMYTLAERINMAMTYQDIVDTVARLTPDCDGGVWLDVWDNGDYENSNGLVMLAASNAPPHMEFLIGNTLSKDQVPIIDKIYMDRLTVFEDVNTDPRVDPVSLATWKLVGTRACVWLSLQKEDQIKGGLFFNYLKSRPFSERQRRIALGMGELVTAATERVRLQMETVSALEKTRQLNEQIQHLTEVEERNRLARELHDSVSQALYGIGLGARTAQAMWETDNAVVKESIDYVLSLAEAALVEMRALIFELRPESLENEGLVTVLAKQGAALQTRHGLDVQIELCEEPPLPLKFKESLYRIAREALHNVIKHAGATQVTLRLAHSSPYVTLEIVDNGIGFDTAQEFPGHLGLQSMRERIFNLRGEMQLKSTPGKGTQLMVKVCYEKEYSR